jgi:hypothetical protein
VQIPIYFAHDSKTFMFKFNTLILVCSQNRCRSVLILILFSAPATGNVLNLNSVKFSSFTEISSREINVIPICLIKFTPFL